MAIINQEVHKYKQAPTLSNGIVSLTMCLKQEAEMPEFIYEEITGNTIQGFSDKHQCTCWRCLAKGHVAAFCKRPLKMQETALKSTTWAKIVAGPTAEAQPEPQANSLQANNGLSPQRKQRTRHRTRTETSECTSLAPQDLEEKHTQIQAKLQNPRLIMAVRDGSD